MSTARRHRRPSQALLRQLQKALATAECISIAADHGEEIDIADAVAGLVILLGMAVAMLDQPRGAP